MKIKSNNVKTNFILIILLIGTFSFGQQIKFNESLLNVLQSIPGIEYTDLNKYLESKNINTSITNNKDNTLLLSFKLNNVDFYLLYTENKKVIYAKTSFFNYEEDNLKQNDFKIYQKYSEEKIVNNEYARYYSKENYPFEFITFHDGTHRFSETDPIGDIYIFNLEFGDFNKYVKLIN